MNAWWLLAAVGCAGSPGLLADAEVFDGSAWAPGPSLEAPRGGHSATLLPDGRIVVLGGAATSSVSAQICDSTGCLEHGALLDHFERHDAVLLSTGKILIGGGASGAHPELYDPGSGAAHEIASPGVAGGEHLVELADHRVLAVSGASTSLFDAATEQWTAGPVLSSNASHVAVALADGRVMAVETCYLCAATSAEILDTAATAWTRAASPHATHLEPTLSLLHDGRVLLVGGGPIDADIGAEVYDPDAGTWNVAAGLAENRTGHAATVLADGRVLVTGGRIEAGLDEQHHPTVALFDPVAQTWTLSDDLAWRQYHAVIAASSGAIAIGGDTGYMDGRNE